MSPEVRSRSSSRREFLSWLIGFAIGTTSLYIINRIASDRESSNQPESLDLNFALQIGDLTNQLRRENNLNELNLHPSLIVSAQNYAHTLAQYNWWGHTAPDGSDFVDRLNASGFNYNTWKGENLVRTGYNYSPEETFKLWVESEGHKANMLNPNFEFIGIACFVKNSTRWCVQEFGGKIAE